jgi:hypothetical protein
MLIIWTSGAASRVRYSVVMSYSGSATANAKMWCEPYALTSTDREPLQGSEHCLHLSLPSCSAALRTAELCDSLR